LNWGVDVDREELGAVRRGDAARVLPFTSRKVAGGINDSSACLQVMRDSRVRFPVYSFPIFAGQRSVNCVFAK
jgi:hypothetical protein